jgi:catechol 2,3-dioxygenase-like lactoylglutathione lyase family enzyme
VLTLRNVTFMTTDPVRLADFWAAALHLTERRDTPDEVVLAHADWPYPRYTFQRVAAGDAARSRTVHLDLLAEDRPQEVARLVALGATEERTVTGDDSGVTWTVLRDPDGNELCVT